MIGLDNAMKFRINTKLCALLALVTLATGVNAETWLTTDKSGSDLISSAAGDPLEFRNANGAELGVWGYSIKRNYSGSSIDSYGSIDGGAYARAYSSGFGVKKNGAYHTLGNNNSSHFDGVLLNFGATERALHSLTVTSFDSWSGKSHDNDRDVQIWRWIGAQPWSNDAFAFNATNHYPSGAYPGVSANVWDTNWAKVGDYYNNKGDGTISFGVNPSSYASSAWLVLAKPNHHDTAIKIGAITTKPGTGGGPGIPLPGTLALLGIGAIALRRRRSIFS